MKPDEVKEDDVVVGPVHHDAVTREEDDGKGGKKTVEVEPAKDMVKINKRPVSISDIHPLWQKTPSQCTDDEYKDFYRKVFNDYREPLFWIHLNMDWEPSSSTATRSLSPTMSRRSCRSTWSHSRALWTVRTSR